MPSLLSKANSLLLLTVLPSIVSAAPAPNQAQQQQGQACSNGAKAATGKAVYFLSNEAENAVVALPIGKDGKVSAGKATKTGGKGSNSLNAMMQPAKPDPLIGQSALTVVGNHIFAVNAGSNTISMLTISKNDPTNLQMVGQPAALPGEFPNTVAASMKNKLVCVGTTGAKAGISCASFSNKGIGKMDGLREFKIGQTTPPVGPTNTVSQTFFSADETQLFTTVKGDPPTNKTGFLSVFPVMDGCLGEKDVQSSPNGTAVLFGSSTIPGMKNQIFTTDASFGAAVLQLDAQGKASVVGKQAIEGQTATCWAAVSDVSGTAFVSDVARNTLVEMSLKDASIVSSMQIDGNGNTGIIDMRAGGNFVYALVPGNKTEAVIAVMDVSAGAGKGKQVQAFGVGKLAGPNAQGMAVLV